MSTNTTTPFTPQYIAGIDVANLPRNHMTIGPGQNPFDKHAAWVSSHTHFVEHFAPRTLFSPAAQRYVDAKTGCRDLVAAQLEMLSLLTLIYHKCRSRIHFPSRRKKRGPAKKKKGNEEEVVEEEEEAEDDSPSAYPGSYERDRAQKLITNRTPTACFATFEVKETHHEDDGTTTHRDVAGISFRVSCNTDVECDPGSDMGKIVYAQLEENERRELAKAEGKKVTPIFNPQPYHRITFDRYFELVSLYTCADVTEEERVFEHVRTRGKRVHPEEVFSLRLALKKAKIAGARDPYFDISRYMTARREPCFPIPASVYLLNDAVALPHNFFTYFWPVVAKTIEQNDEERRAFIRMFVPDAPPLPTVKVEDEDVDDEELQRRQEQEEARKAAEEEVGGLYDMHMKNRVLGFADGVTPEPVVEGCRRRNKERMENVERMAGGDRQKYRILRAAALTECYRDFLQNVWHKDAYIPDSVKAVIEWGEKHLQKHKHFRMPFHKQSRNLSGFGDVFASMAAQMESGFNVAHSQSGTVLGLMQSMDQWSFSTFHCNNAMFSECAKGKSRQYQTEMKCLIEGTYADYAYATAKSNAAPGLGNTQKSIYHQEVRPTSIGVQPQQNGKGGNAQTNNTDEESMLKIMMTEGHINCSYNFQNPETGKREKRDVKAECNNVWKIASNAKFHQVPNAISDRFVCTTIQQQERVDNGGLFVKMQATDPSPQAQESANRISYRWMRDHYMNCLIDYLIYCYCLKPVDKTAANTILFEVLKRARAAGLTHTESARHYQRMTIICRNVAKTRGVYTLFDSELSPFKGGNVEWNLERDMRLLEPYLFVAEEDVCITSGLLHGQYDNDGRKILLRTMAETLFAQVIKECESDKFPYPDVERRRLESLNRYRANFPEHKQEKAGYDAEDDEKRQANDRHRAMKESLYYIIKYPRTSSESRSSSSSSSYNTKDELINKLAHELLMKMNARPQLDDVKFAIQTLCSLPVRNSSGEVTGNDFGLNFINGELHLAKSLVQDFETTSLRNIVKDVLCDVATKQQQYIYGQTLGTRPYIWQTIVAKPKEEEDRKRIKVINPYYFDDVIQQYTLAAVADMDEAARTKKNREEKAHFASSFFNEQPYRYIDCSVDRYVATKRLYDIGFTKKDIEHLPPPLPSALKKRIIESLPDSQRDALHFYPESMIKAQKQISAYGEDADEEERTNKRRLELMSARRQVRRMEKEIGLELLDEDDGEVCEAGQDEEELQIDTRKLQKIRERESSRLCALIRSSSAPLVLTQPAPDPQPEPEQQVQRHSVEDEQEARALPLTLDSDDPVSVAAAAIDAQGSKRCTSPLVDENDYYDQLLREQEYDDDD